MCVSFLFADGVEELNREFINASKGQKRGFFQI